MPKTLDEEILALMRYTIDKIIRLADKYGEDRDKIARRTARSFYTAVMIGTFKEYKYTNKEE